MVSWGVAASIVCPFQSANLSHLPRPPPMMAEALEIGEDLRPARAVTGIIEPAVSRTSSTTGESQRERARQICDQFIKSHFGTFVYHAAWPNSIPLLSDGEEETRGRRERMRERLKEQLWAAACLRDYQLACAQRAYEVEIELIEREYQTEKTHLKEKLLADLMAHRRRLLEGKEEEHSGGKSYS